MSLVIMPPPQSGGFTLEVGRCIENIVDISPIWIYRIVSALSILFFRYIDIVSISATAISTHFYFTRRLCPVCLSVRLYVRSSVANAYPSGTAWRDWHSSVIVLSAVSGRSADGPITPLPDKLLAAGAYRVDHSSRTDLL